jgi:hypothetical protein
MSPMIVRSPVDDVHIAVVYCANIGLDPLPSCLRRIEVDRTVDQVIEAMKMFAP